MYEREEHKSSTSPDGTSIDHKITERSTNGLTELFLVPIGLCLTAVTCGLILQIGIKLSHSINQNTIPPTYHTNY